MILQSTPYVLIKVGVEQWPIHISKSVLKKVTTSHNLTREALFAIPKNLHEPVMVFRSSSEPNSVVVLTELKDDKQNPIIVAIHLIEEYGFAVINNIASIYGKENRSFVKDWANNGKVLYYDKQKYLEMLHSRGLQLPKENTLRGTNPNIITESDIVKPFTEYEELVRTRFQLAPEFN